MNKQKAIITGAEGCLGSALSASLVSGGMEVWAPGRESLDVSQSEHVQSYFSEVGDVDLLVCNAGVTADKPLLRMTVEDWDQVMQVNLKGAFRCAREVSRGMVKRRSGHIVLISSFSAIHPPIGQANYAASKAAMLGMMKSMARELGPRNVRVNAILPGFLQTRMTEELENVVKEAARDNHVLGRFNTPQVVADFVNFLHHQMPHTSGQVFNLDSRIL